MVKIVNKNLLRKMTKKKPKSEHKKAGRPTIMAPDVVAKLEQAFMNAFTDEQACIVAKISRDTLYDYIKKNPSFSVRKEELKKRVDIKAKTKLVQAINGGDMNSIKFWLERKCKDEFSLKTETEHSGEVKSKVVYIEKEEKENYKKHINQVIDGD
jgi:hypothetical protein